MSQINLDTVSWAEIEQMPNNVEKLRLLCHSQNELRGAGYIVEPLSTRQLQLKQRCEKCGVRNKPRRRMRTRNELPGPELRLTTGARLRAEGDEGAGPGPQGRVICSYHIGRVVKKICLYCKQHVSEPGCAQAQCHTFGSLESSSFRKQWAYFGTPTIVSGPRATAIALDCEMGSAVTGETELLRLTAVDIFTKKVLINKLVKPSVPVKDYRTRFSGVSAKMMQEAVGRRDCIFGRDAARQLLWRFAGPETVIVAHGGCNDLSALRWIHPLVVDTYILQGYEPKLEGGRSLKNLCAQMCQLDIQNGRGHDSLEDAMACRELLHRWMLSIPE